MCKYAWGRMSARVCVCLMGWFYGRLTLIESYNAEDRRCPWCNGYRRRNWTRRHEFKSWTDCISHSTSTLGKGMNPIILPPTMGK